MTLANKLDNESAEFCLPAGAQSEGELSQDEIFYINLTDHFGLNDDAARFVTIIKDFSQFFDDVVDGDEITRKDADKNIFNCFIGLNSNPFFINNRVFLLPILDLILLKWQASDEAELKGIANEKSFMWRAGFYDLLLATISICRGHEFAKSRAVDVMNFYAETFEDYRKEFPKNG